MHRRTTILIAVIAVIASACGSDLPDTVPLTPATAAPPAGNPQVTVSTATGLEFTFDVTSCTSPGSNIVNLQGEGADGTFRLAASAEGVIRISGPTDVEATVDEVEVADDGSVAASGTLALADAPDVAVPFQLRSEPGSCP